MSRGKPLCVGPTARLARGHDLGAAGRHEPGRRSAGAGAFPVPVAAAPASRPTAARSSRKMQIAMFPRLERFDVEFDLPDAFLPEFPPAIFLQNRPELGDVSRGEVVSINNYYRLFKDILTPVQLDGLRLLLTPLPAGGVQPDRRPQEPAAEPGRDLLRLPRQRPHHRPVPPQPRHPPAGAPLPAGHGQPARRVQPADPRLQAEPALGRGLHRVRAADGLLQRRPDPRHEEGVQRSRPRAGHATWPRCRTCSTSRPRRSSTCIGRLDPTKATESELRGEKLFFGKGQCAACHPAPFYLDHQMHDLHLERFLKDEPGDGPIKSFTLRGIKDSPPYLHDGRCLTLEDTVEFFNLVLQTEAEQPGEEGPGRVHAAALVPRLTNP